MSIKCNAVLALTGCSKLRIVIIELKDKVESES